MVFRTTSGRTLKLRLSVPAHLGRKPRTLSCGTDDPATAKDVARVVQRLKRRREWAPLLAVLDGRGTLAALYDADRAGRIDQFVAQANDVDLAPLVDELLTNAKYRKHVRCLIPTDKRFPASRFTKGVISTFLDGLSCSNSTKNRYRASLSVFAGRLEEREVIEYNPVSKVKPKPKNEVPFIYLRPQQYRALVDSCSPYYRALFALLYGTGMELGAALKVTPREVDAERRTVWAHARHTKRGKTPYRSRECAVDEWAWPIVWTWVRQFTPDARCWTMRGESANRYHGKRLTAKGFSPMRLHNSRHSFAVAHRRAGDPDPWIAHQLGHKDTHMVERTYGNFPPDPVADRVKQALQ